MKAGEPGQAHSLVPLPLFSRKLRGSISGCAVEANVLILVMLTLKRVLINQQITSAVFDVSYNRRVRYELLSVRCIWVCFGLTHAMMHGDWG